MFLNIRITEKAARDLNSYFLKTNAEFDWAILKSQKEVLQP